MSGKINPNDNIAYRTVVIIGAMSPIWLIGLAAFLYQCAAAP